MQSPEKIGRLWSDPQPSYFVCLIFLPLKYLQTLIQIIFVEILVHMRLQTSKN